jgi:phosphate-selective porin OprO/OprP
MWQLGARYDHMDLNDGNVNANPVAGRPPIVDGVLVGEMDIWTVGVNYYWRSNTKFALNYVMVDSKKYNSTARAFVNDDPNILEARLQFFW